MNTNQIEYLIKIVELGSIGKAAKFFNTPYQNIAYQIYNLETEFDVEIFHRTNRGSVLTEQGKKIFELCLNVSDLYKKTKTTVKLDNTIRLGVDLYYIHPSIIDFISKNKDLNVVLVSIQQTRLFDCLSNNTIDCFFGYKRNHDQNIFFKELRKDKMVAVMSQEHILSHNKIIRYSDFSDTKVYIGHFDNIDGLISKKILSNSIHCELIHDCILSLVIADVLTNNAIAIVPENHISLFGNKISYIPFENVTDSYGIYYNVPSLAVKHMIDTFQAYTAIN